jgi:translocation and assembly module TamA
MNPRKGFGCLVNYCKKLVVFSFFLLAAPTILANDSAKAQIQDKSVLANAQEGIEYSIKLPPNLPAELLAKIEEVSLLILHKARLPGSLGGLIKRAENDKLLFEKVLQAFGYYSGSVTMRIDVNKNPVEIIFEISLGDVYTLENVELECAKEIECTSLEHDLKDVLGLQLGTVVTADEAIAVKQILEKYFAQKGYPFINVSNPEAEIDHKNRKVTLIYPVHLGGKCIITDSVITSSKQSLDYEFIRNRLLWQKGDVYDSRVVEKTRRFLTQTGLFDSISVKPKYANSADEEINNDSDQEKSVIMEVDAVEAPPRSIAAGLHYDTTQGAEARASWEHYNLMGHGENLGVNVRASKIRSKARLHYDIPDFLVSRQTWRNETFLMKENTRAYKGQTYELSSKLERQLTDEFLGSLGISLETGHIQPKTNSKKVPIRLIGVPFELRLDASNDLLNPTRGFRANGAITPYTGKLGSSKGMLLVQGGASAYIPFATNTLDEDGGTLAIFAKGGQIQIRNFSELPPNKRFYGGGSGSIRGYGFQKIGPIDKNSIPLGGQSMFELGTELRHRFSESLGGVVFFEGGNVWEKNILNVKKDILWGTGFGLRYYTTYAPIRIDLAFPLKRRKLAGERKSYDAPYQFYVSVGQAF